MWGFLTSRGLSDQFHRRCLVEASVVALHVQSCPCVEDCIQQTESGNISDQLAWDMPSGQCLTCYAACSGVLEGGRLYVRWSTWQPCTQTLLRPALKPLPWCARTTSCSPLPTLHPCLRQLWSLWIDMPRYATLIATGFGTSAWESSGLWTQTCKGMSLSWQQVLAPLPAWERALIAVDGPAQSAYQQWHVPSHISWMQSCTVYVALMYECQHSINGCCHAECSVQWTFSVFANRFLCVTNWSRHLNQLCKSACPWECVSEIQSIKEINVLVSQMRFGCRIHILPDP